MHLSHIHICICGACTYGIRVVITVYPHTGYEYLEQRGAFLFEECNVCVCVCVCVYNSVIMLYKCKCICMYMLWIYTERE